MSDQEPQDQQQSPEVEEQGQSQSSFLFITIFIAICLAAIVVFTVYLSRSKPEQTSSRYGFSSYLQVKDEIPPRANTNLAFFREQPAYTYFVIGNMWAELTPQDIASFESTPTEAARYLINNAYHMGGDAIWFNPESIDKPKQEFVTIRFAPVPFEKDIYEQMEKLDDNTPVADIVINVSEGSQAEKEGIRPGFVLWKLNGERLPADGGLISQKLQKARESAPSIEVTFLIPPEGKEQTVTFDSAEKLGIFHQMQLVMDVEQQKQISEEMRKEREAGQKQEQQPAPQP